MNEFSEMINEVIFFNTPLELKEGLRFVPEENQIEIKSTNSKNKEEYLLFGYAEFEDKDRIFRYKNKIIVSLSLEKRISTTLFIQNIDIELTGGIELLNKPEKISSFLYNLNDVIPLKDFIKEKLIEKLTNDLLTTKEVEIFNMKKAFINKHTILLKDLKELNVTITSEPFLLFN